MKNLNANRTNRKSAPHEGKRTEAVEQVTARLPSMTWLILAGGALAAASIAAIRERRNPTNLMGVLVPSFLLLGVYNKLVKQHGSDQESAVIH